MNSECCELLEDAVLKSAFRTALEKEIAAVEAVDVAVRYPSAAQRRAELRALRRMRSRDRKPNRVAHAAAMIGAVFALSFAMLMLQPTVRASMVNAVVSFFEDHMSITFHGQKAEMQYSIGDYAVTYIPTGYTLTEVSDRVFSYSQTYTKGDSHFRINYYSAGNVKFSLDTEHTTIKTVQIGDVQGYLVKFDDSGDCSLHWGEDNYAFEIKGTITEKEILKIAKGIQAN